MKHLIKTWSGDDYACGQYSLAMATGCAVIDVMQAVGHKGAASLKQLREASERLGFDVSDVCEDFAGRGIVIIHDATETMGHAMAWEDGNVYDPDGEFSGSIAELIEHCKPYGWGITHLLRVEPAKTREWNVGEAKQKEEA